MAGDAPQPGTIVDGYRFKGGDPANAASWVEVPAVGSVVDGLRFKGGDPAKQDSWESTEKGVFGRVADTLIDTATYGPLGMVIKAADKVTGRNDAAALDNLKTGAIRGISGLAGMPQMIVDAPSMIAGAITGKPMAQPSQVLEKATGIPWLPSQATVQDAITQAPTMIGQAPIAMNKPETMGGRLLQDVGQAIGSAPFAPMIGYGIASGLGSWGAGELTNQNPWAKLAGSVAGAGLYGLAQNTVPTSVSMVRRRLEQYSPAELNQGQAIQREAAARGVQLLPNEALDQSRAGPLSQLVGNTAVMPQGLPVQRFAAARVAPGGSIPTAIDDAANAIAPRVANPNEAARALGTAADKAVMEPMNARAAAANMRFDRAAQDVVDPAARAAIIAEIDAAIGKAHPSGAVRDALLKMRGAVDEAQTVGHMKEVLGGYRAVAKAPAYATNTAPVEVQKALKPQLRTAFAQLEATNPEFQAAREIYKGTAAGPSPLTVAVDQAQASPAARIAAAQVDPATDGALGAFGAWLKGGGANVPAPAPAVVKSEIARIAKQDPQAARDALRAVIQRHADTAFNITKEGVPPVDSGVGFVKSLAGTDDTRKAMLAAVEAVTGNQTTAKGFDRLLEIVQRTGVTPGLGSPTVTRGLMATEAGQGGPLGAALQGANLSRGSLIGYFQNLNETARAGKAWGELADLFTQPDSVAKLRQLALMDPGSNKAKALAATILQGVGQAPQPKGTPR